MLELLAPAGSMEALIAAVQNGADAVYLGSGMFNARQGAKNFTPQALIEAVKYCHVRGVAVHLTLNTLVSDKETEALCDLIRQAAVSGVDAFIVQDLSVVQLCRQIAPSVPVHASTQMSIHSLPGVLLCAAAGCSRVVLSRELTREQIKDHNVDQKYKSIPAGFIQNPNPSSSYKISIIIPLLFLRIPTLLDIILSHILQKHNKKRM